MELKHLSTIIIMIVIIIHSHISGMNYINANKERSILIKAIIGTIFVVILAAFVVYWNW